MKAVKFKGCNTNIAEDQDEYKTLPALKFNNKFGTMITCYSLNFWERLRVLFLGKIWLSEMTFNKPITPRIHSTNKNDLFETSEI